MIKRVSKINTFRRTNILGYTADGIPIIAAVRSGNDLSFYCQYCKRKHYHGGKDGHRVAHCWVKPDSPFQKTGYILKGRDKI